MEVPGSHVQLRNYVRNDTHEMIFMILKHNCMLCNILNGQLFFSFDQRTARRYIIVLRVPVQSPLKRDTSIARLMRFPIIYTASLLYQCNPFCKVAHAKTIRKIGVKGRSVMGLSRVHCPLHLHRNGCFTRVSTTSCRRLVTTFSLVEQDSNAMRLITLETDASLSRDISINAFLAPSFNADIYYGTKKEATRNFYLF